MTMKEKAVAEIKAAWQQYRATEKYGLEFGKVCCEWRDKFGQRRTGPLPTNSTKSNFTPLYRRSAESKRREVTMSAVHPIEVLDDRLRDLLELFESDLSDPVDQVTEKFSGKIERLTEQFGPEELELNLKYYPLTVLPRNLHQAFGPVSALRWQDEE
jgi:hypothetical protein